MRCMRLNTNKCMSFSIPSRKEIIKQNKPKKKKEKSNYLQFEVY